MSVYF